MDQTGNWKRRQRLLQFAKSDSVGLRGKAEVNTLCELHRTNNWWPSDSRILQIYPPALLPQTQAP
jgi:hypothetical protein